MKDFNLPLKFEDAQLTAAILEALIGIRASQSALTALLLQDIARRSRRDIEEVTARYETLREDFQVNLIADLELNYSLSELATSGDKAD